MFIAGGRVVFMLGVCGYLMMFVLLYVILYNVLCFDISEGMVKVCLAVVCLYLILCILTLPFLLTPFPPADPLPA